MMNPRGLIYSLMLKDATSSGVLDTLDSRLESLQTEIPDSYGLCFYRGKEPDTGRYQHVRFVRVRAKTRGLSHILFPFYLWKWIKASGDNPLYVLIRYHFPSPLFLALFRKRSFALVSEHHTDLDSNLTTLTGFAGKLLPFLSRAIRKSTDSVIDGHIGLTSEILRALPHAPKTLVLANGINPQESSRKRFKEFDGQSLNALTIISSDWQWNGLERMIYSMERWASHRPDIAFRLTVIGPRIQPLARSSGGRVDLEFLGPKKVNEIADRVNCFNLAFSTMGLWKMGLEEACPLKSRTYIGLGIPFISAYADPDVNDSRLFVARFPNSAEPISWSDVERFLKVLSQSRGEVLEDFSRARVELSHQAKSRQLNFFLRGLGPGSLSGSEAG